MYGILRPTTGSSESGEKILIKNSHCSYSANCEGGKKEKDSQRNEWGKETHIGPVPYPKTYKLKPRLATIELTLNLVMTWGAADV